MRGRCDESGQTTAVGYHLTAEAGAAQFCLSYANFTINRKALSEQELCVFTEEYDAELCKTENFQNLLKNSRIYATIKLPETFSVI